jgi:hypothetical protein
MPLWERRWRRTQGILRFSVYLKIGNAVVGRSCNGRDFWTDERSPGDWVFLAELRKP